MALDRLFESRHRYTAFGVIIALLVLCILGAIHFYSPWLFRGTPGPEQNFTVDEIRSRIDQRGYQWEPVENEFTRMSPEERKAFLGGVPEEDEDEELKEKRGEESEDKPEAGPERSRGPGTGQPEPLEPGASSRAAGVVLPSTVDYREVATPVKNQQQCGSCWAFASLAVVEAQFRRQDPRVRDIDLSEQYLLSCEGSCRGHSVGAALRFLKDHGAPLETCGPYRAVDDKKYCSSSCSGGELIKISDYKGLQRLVGGALTVESPDLKLKASDQWIKGVQQALLERGPLVVLMRAQADFWFYGSGIYRAVTRQAAGYHVVALFGYNEPERYWIVKNSWGTGWGMNGYAHISWDDEYSLLGRGLYAVAVEKPGPPPKPDESFPAKISFQPDVRERLSKLVSDVSKHCANKEEIHRLQPVRIRAVVHDLKEKIVNSSQLLGGVTAHLYVNDAQAAALRESGGRLEGEFRWGDLPLRENNSFVLKGDWKSPDPAGGQESRGLHGETFQVRAAPRIKPTNKAAEEKSVTLKSRGGALAGAFLLDLKQYFEVAGDCGGVEFVMGVESAERTGLPEPELSPSRLVLERDGEARTLVLSFPAARPQDMNSIEVTMRLTVTPMDSTQGIKPVAFPLQVVYTPELIERLPRYTLPLVICVVLVLLVFLIRRMIFVDKQNFWTNRIAAKSPEDFWQKGELFSPKTNRVISSREQFLEIIKDAANDPRFKDFLRVQRWRHLAALEKRCLAPFEETVVFPLGGEPIILSSFQEGERVFRSRRADLQDGFARIETSAEASSAVFYPLKGLFRDGDGRYLPLGKAVPVKSYLSLTVGQDQSASATILLALGAGDISIQVKGL